MAQQGFSFSTRSRIPRIQRPTQMDMDYKGLASQERRTNRTRANPTKMAKPSKNFLRETARKAGSTASKGFRHL